MASVGFCFFLFTAFIGRAASADNCASPPYVGGNDILHTALPLEKKPLTKRDSLATPQDKGLAVQTPRGKGVLAGVVESEYQEKEFVLVFYRLRDGRQLVLPEPRDSVSVMSSSRDREQHAEQHAQQEEKMKKFCRSFQREGTHKGKDKPFRTLFTQALLLHWDRPLTAYESPVNQHGESEALRSNSRSRASIGENARAGNHSMSQSSPHGAHGGRLQWLTGAEVLWGARHAQSMLEKLGATVGRGRGLVVVHGHQTSHFYFALQMGCLFGNHDVMNLNAYISPRMAWRRLVGAAANRGKVIVFCSAAQADLWVEVSGGQATVVVFDYPLGEGGGGGDGQQVLDYNKVAAGVCVPVLADLSENEDETGADSVLYVGRMGSGGELIMVVYDRVRLFDMINLHPGHQDIWLSVSPASSGDIGNEYNALVAGSMTVLSSSGYYSSDMPLMIRSLKTSLLLGTAVQQRGLVANYHLRRSALGKPVSKLWQASFSSVSACTTGGGAQDSSFTQWLQQTGTCPQVYDSWGCYEAGQIAFRRLPTREVILQAQKQAAAWGNRRGPTALSTAALAKLQNFVSHAVPFQLSREISGWALRGVGPYVPERGAGELLLQTEALANYTDSARTHSKLVYAEGREEEGLFYATKDIVRTTEGGDVGKPGALFHMYDKTNGALMLNRAGGGQDGQHSQWVRSGWVERVLEGAAFGKGLVAQCGLYVVERATGELGKWRGGNGTSAGYEVEDGVLLALVWPSKLAMSKFAKQHDGGSGDRGDSMRERMASGLEKYIRDYLGNWAEVAIHEVPTAVVMATEAWEVRPRYKIKAMLWQRYKQDFALALQSISHSSTIGVASPPAPPQQLSSSSPLLGTAPTAVSASDTNSGSNAWPASAAAAAAQPSRYRVTTARSLGVVQNAFFSRLLLRAAAHCAAGPSGRGGQEERGSFESLLGLDYAQPCQVYAEENALVCRRLRHSAPAAGASSPPAAPSRWFALLALLGCTRPAPAAAPGGKKGEGGVDIFSCMLRSGQPLETPSSPALVLAAAAGENWLREPLLSEESYRGQDPVQERLERWDEVPWQLWDMRLLRSDTLSSPSPFSSQWDFASQGLRAEEVVRQIEELWACRQQLEHVAPMVLPALGKLLPLNSRFLLRLRHAHKFATALDTRRLLEVLGSDSQQLPESQVRGIFTLAHGNWMSIFASKQNALP